LEPELNGNMKRIAKYLNGFLILLVCGCEKLTEEEFKQKYDWAETICTIGNYAGKPTSGLKRINFVYAKKEYQVFGSGFTEIEKGYQYHILFDKNAPDKNYLILFHRPVRPDRIADFTMTGKIQKVFKSDTKKNSRWKHFLHVTYKCYSTGDNNWIKYEEAIPLEYYDKLKELEQNQSDITVDCYITKEYSNGTGEIRTFINLEKLTNQSIP